MERGRYRDEDLLAVLPYAKGYDRELLIHALGLAEPDPSGDAVTMLKHVYATEKSHTRSAALWALAHRGDYDATDDLVAALQSTSFNLQERAAMLLGEFGGADAVDAMLVWLDTKLQSKSRPKFSSPYTIPPAVQLATRSGRHGDAARVIRRRAARLVPDEQAWLRRTWPGLSTVDDPTDAPAPVRLTNDVYERDEGRDPATAESIEAGWWANIDEAYARARRRADRAEPR